MTDNNEEETPTPPDPGEEKTHDFKGLPVKLDPDKLDALAHGLMSKQDFIFPIIHNEDEANEKYQEVIEVIKELSGDSLYLSEGDCTTFSSTIQVYLLKCHKMFQCFGPRVK